MRNPRFALFVLLAITTICTGLVVWWEGVSPSSYFHAVKTEETAIPTHGVVILPAATYEPLATTTAYLLTDITNNATLLEKNPDMKLPIASSFVRNRASNMPAFP